MKIRLISNKGEYVQDVCTYTRENHRGCVFPKQELVIEKHEDEIHTYYHEFPARKRGNNLRFIIYINSNWIVVIDNYKPTTIKYKCFSIVNINKRLFIEQIKNHCTYKDSAEFCADLILRGDDINKQDIEFYINKLYPQQYNHHNCYLPEPQDISDVWLVDEREILGDIADSQEEFEDEGYDINPCDLRSYDQMVIYVPNKHLDNKCGTVWRRI